MSGLRNRQYSSIWNSVNAKNYKQALKTIDKKLSKCSDDYLDALKFYVHGKIFSSVEQINLLIQLEELACRNSFIRDPNIIDLYDESLTQDLPGSPEIWAKTIGELRWKCVKLISKDEILCLDAFKECLLNEDLHHARQIVNVMEKNLPHNRNYVFWNVTMMVLFSLSDICPDDQKKLWKSLAYAQIIKIADTTISIPGKGDSPIKSIQTPQEILLLHRILKSSENSEKSYEYLQDTQLGPESPAAKDEWELWRLKLKLLSKLEKWQELFEVSMTLLKRSRLKDTFGRFSEARLGDWIVWNALIISATELNNQTYFSRVRTEIELQLDPELKINKSWRRNASLAYVKFNFDSDFPFLQGSEKVTNGSYSIKILAFLKYLSEYGDTNMVFNDLRPFIDALRPTERTIIHDIIVTGVVAEGLSHAEEQNVGWISTLRKISSIDMSSIQLSNSDGVTRALNMLKLRFLLTCYSFVKKSNQIAQSSETYLDPLLQLSRESMKLYKIAIDNSLNITKNLLVTDRHPADDIAVIASMCLVKLGLADGYHQKNFLKGKKSSRILQAAVTLEFAWTHSKYNFQISLLLIRLYSFLGCGSLAMRAYQRLALKQIQQDTLSYTLFDRISTFHPHPFDHLADTSMVRCSPAQNLRQQRKFYSNSTRQISSNVWLSFQHGNYNSILEMREVSDRLSLSLSNIACTVESRKISRLLEPSNKFDTLPSNFEEIPFSNTLKLWDNNDYSTFPSFESSQGPSFHEICNFFPPPTVLRTRSSVFREQVQYILSLRSDSTDIEYALGQKWLERYYNQHDNIGLSAFGMTDSEAVAHDAYRLFALIAYISCKGSDLSGEDLHRCLHTYYTDLLEVLKKQHKLVSELESVVPASQHVLHTLYTAYEVGITAVALNRYVASWDKSAVRTQLAFATSITQSANSLIEDLVKTRHSIKTHLDKGGWIDQVLEIIDDDIKKIVHEDFMEEWAGLVVESWRESIIGLDYLKSFE